MIFIVLIIVLLSHIFLNKNVNIRDRIVKITNELGDFPRPQISRGYKQLSKQAVQDPLYNLGSQKIDESKVNIIRSSNIDNDKNPIYHNPSF